MAWFKWLNCITCLRKSTNLRLITKEGLESAFTRMKLGKLTPGVDNITSETVKFIDDAGKESFRSLLN